MDDDDVELSGDNDGVTQDSRQAGATLGQRLVKARKWR